MVVVKFFIHMYVSQFSQICTPIAKIEDLLLLTW